MEMALLQTLARRWWLTKIWRRILGKEAEESSGSGGRSGGRGGLGSGFGGGGSWAEVDLGMRICVASIIFLDSGCYIFRIWETTMKNQWPWWRKYRPMVVDDEK
ncbi:hypothetical protein KSP39_PZI002278 [Platanthera zijinensis]|uniref:Uncharacterized protein n=1 Tax=Platanthera zijinensis TaxID=2320716 RepID=A0AAP0BZ88_9ASPA